MKYVLIVCLAALLSACSTPSFVGDAPPVRMTDQTPGHFELPARFALARTVYGAAQPAGAEETALWADLVKRADSFGSFTPLVSGASLQAGSRQDNLIAIARRQRYKYLMLVRMHPETGSADVVLYHVGSGGVMATAHAVSPGGGQRGFWGGVIRNPARLERTTLAIAEATVPVVEEMLRGAARRQR